METGIELIAQERKRQIEELGHTVEHYEEFPEIYGRGQLVSAAIGYALPDDDTGEGNIRYGQFSDGMPRWWPWPKVYWKPTPHDRIRELSKAGALIAAEIDRLQALQQEKQVS